MITVLINILLSLVFVSFLTIIFINFMLWSDFFFFDFNSQHFDIILRDLNSTELKSWNAAADKSVTEEETWIQLNWNLEVQQQERKVQEKRRLKQILNFEKKWRNSLWDERRMIFIYNENVMILNFHRFWLKIIM